MDGRTDADGGQSRTDKTPVERHMPGRGREQAGNDGLDPRNQQNRAQECQQSVRPKSKPNEMS